MIGAAGHGKDIAIGRIDVSRPELRVKARAGRGTFYRRSVRSRIGQQFPTKLVPAASCPGLRCLRVRGPGPQIFDVTVEELNRVVPYFLAATFWIVGVGSMRGTRRIGKHVTKIG